MAHKQARNEQIVEQVNTRRGVAVYDANPFMVEMTTKTRRVTNKRGDMMLVSNEGELVSQVAGFWEAEEVDSAKFVKLFVKGVKALKELTAPGTKVSKCFTCECRRTPGRIRGFHGVRGSRSSLNSDGDISTYKREWRSSASGSKRPADGRRRRSVRRQPVRQKPVTVVVCRGLGRVVAGAHPYLASPTPESEYI